MTARYLIGDVRDRLAEIPDGSVDLVLTSPPFLQLRSYLADDDPNKHREIGSEPTPAEYLTTLLRLTDSLADKLALHGSLAVELGDTVSRTATVGWTDCGHDSWRRGLVLDPFAGSGTTLKVATGLGRDALGIDLDARNLDLARERVGLLLIEEPA